MDPKDLCLVSSLMTRPLEMLSLPSMRGNPTCQLRAMHGCTYLLYRTGRFPFDQIINRSSIVSIPGVLTRYPAETGLVLFICLSVFNKQADYCTVYPFVLSTAHYYLLLLALWIFNSERYHLFPISNPYCSGIGRGGRCSRYASMTAQYRTVHYCRESHL